MGSADGSLMMSQCLGSTGFHHRLANKYAIHLRLYFMLKLHTSLQLYCFKLQTILSAEQDISRSQSMESTTFGGICLLCLSS
jgi:hypothetical protein